MKDAEEVLESGNGKGGYKLEAQLVLSLRNALVGARQVSERFKSWPEDDTSMIIGSEQSWTAADKGPAGLLRYLVHIPIMNG